MNLRGSLHETTTEAQRKSKGAGSLGSLMKHKRAFITVLGFTAGGSLIFYTFTTYMQKYLVNTVGMSKETGSLVMTIKAPSGQSFGYSEFRESLYGQPPY